MLDYINAVYDGAERRLRLPRDLLQPFEAELGGSAFDVLRRLTGGKWTIGEVQLVLEYATLSPADARFARTMAGLASFPRPPAEHDRVARLLQGRPPARYAVLAALILEAAMYGIAKDAAFFDENADDGEIA